MARCILFRSEVLQHIYLTQNRKHSSNAQKSMLDECFYSIRPFSLQSAFLAQTILYFLPRAPMYSGCVRFVFGPPSELDNLLIIIDQILNR